MKRFYIYIVASKKCGTLYVGITSDLARRIYEHRNGLISGFTKRYACKHLVYYEEYATSLEAIGAKRN